MNKTEIIKAAGILKILSTAFKASDAVAAAPAARAAMAAKTVAPMLAGGSPLPKAVLLAQQVGNLSGTPSRRDFLKNFIGLAARAQRKAALPPSVPGMPMPRTSVVQAAALSHAAPSRRDFLKHTATAMADPGARAVAGNFVTGMPAAVHQIAGILA